MIDNSSCLSAVQNIKSNVAKCFAKCEEKGSTYKGAELLNKLEQAIDSIPQNASGGESGGTISENINGGSFELFTVTFPEDEPFPNEFTIDFGGVGVTWRSIVCYSDTNEGHFSIVKIGNNKCIISASVFYNIASRWDEQSGIYPSGRGTYRARYTISGNTIHFENDEYEATLNGWDDYDEFSSLPNQVSNFTNDYFSDQYKLNKIIVCV